MKECDERIQEGQMNKENQSRQKDMNQIWMKEDDTKAECRNGQLWGFFFVYLF